MEPDIRALIEQFREAARSHSKGTLEGDYKLANRSSDRAFSIFQEIRRAGPTAREALVQLAVDGDLMEAGLAATYSMKYDPIRSVQALRKVSRSTNILGLVAKQAIQRWERGEWKNELDPD